MPGVSYTHHPGPFAHHFLTLEDTGEEVQLYLSDAASALKAALRPGALVSVTGAEVGSPAAAQLAAARPAGPLWRDQESIVSNVFSDLVLDVVGVVPPPQPPAYEQQQAGQQAAAAAAGGAAPWGAGGAKTRAFGTPKWLIVNVDWCGVKSTLTKQVVMARCD